MLLDPLHPPPKLLEVAHVAHRLCVSQEFVRRLIRDGTLPAIRLGRRWRVEPEALQAFIDRQRRAARVEDPGRGREGPRPVPVPDARNA